MPGFVHFRGLIPHARATVVAAALILVGSLGTESCPLVLGTGRHARLDWGFPYVTMRFVVLPAASIGLVVFGLAGLIPSLRAHSRASVVAILLALAVPILFLALSYLLPLPWLEVALHGSAVPPN
jgi:hypothetical protein